MQKAERRLQAILKKAENSNISPEMISKLEISKKLCNSRRKFKFWHLLLIVVISSALFCLLYSLHSEEIPYVWMFKSYVNVAFLQRKILYRIDCSMCMNVSQVDKVSDISPEDFDRLYAATARPVVVIDGTKGWEAVDLFTFDFFKELYTSVTRNHEDRTECQFFPYKTEFHTLMDVFNMSTARSRLEIGTEHWYIGWSNCNDEAGKILRQFYREPYFLPNTSENMALNWIFMGGPGSGAHMHVDDVLYPSWQAQLKGKKTWNLAPPPECLYKCKSFQVTVEPEEIIVVDTNRWYHQTHVLPGSISITIGSEFD